MLRCDIKESEKQTIARFLGGLKKEFADAIRLQTFWTFNDVRKLAITIEQQRTKFSSKTTPKAISSNQGSAASGSNKPLVKGEFASKNEVKGDGSTVQKSSNSNSARKCYKCQGYGHIVFKCPNRRVLTIRKDVIEEEEEEVNQEEGKTEEIIEHADEGEALCIDFTEIRSFACLPGCSSVQMQNEGLNGGHSCEQDLEKQGKSREGLSVVGSGALALDRRLATQFLLSPEMSRRIQDFFFWCQNSYHPIELAKLKNLTQFRINDNNFNGRIPDFIQNWKGLRRLKNQGSGLKGPIPSSISVLKKTRTIED
ncbi:hypothetical protein LWI29_017085 [Acer saccharum]|uniref:CCHC-type domain-containing protein n=1 Tax=Acer saccharum TaxID=4024 RepID=A0AA39RYT3_ACESA|nr:hypothetical protein LWI29_017085 [Acer saccharum]